MARSSIIMNSARWVFNTSSWMPTSEQVLLATSCIQQEEKLRIGRFVFRRDAKASLIGRLLMRKFIADYSGRSYSSVYFDRDEKGKPYLLAEDGKKDDILLNFNISHQGDFAVLAGEVGRTQVGVDVMKIEYSGGKNIADFFRLMYRHFSPEEWVTINGPSGTNDSNKLAMFYRYWCLKESYVKATGTGITVDLQRISFKLNTQSLKVGVVTEDTKVYVDGKELPEWHFEETLLDGNHCVAVAVSSRIHATAPFKLLDFDELMRDCNPLLQPDPVFTSNFLTKEEKP